MWKRLNIMWWKWLPPMAQLASVVLTALSLKFFRPAAHCSIVAQMLLSKCRTEYTSSKLPKRQQKWFYNTYNSKTKHKGRPNRVDSLFFYHYPFLVTYPRTELVSADSHPWVFYRMCQHAGYASRGKALTFWLHNHSGTVWGKYVYYSDFNLYCNLIHSHLAL